MQSQGMAPVRVASQVLPFLRLSEEGVPPANPLYGFLFWYTLAVALALRARRFAPPVPRSFSPVGGVIAAATFYFGACVVLTVLPGIFVASTLRKIAATGVAVGLLAGTLVRVSAAELKESSG